MRRRSTRVERTRGPTRFTRASAVDAGDEWDPTTVPVLDAREVHARLAARTHAKARDTYAAFYSSWCVQCVHPSMPRVPEHPSPSSSKHKTENEKKLTSPRSDCHLGESLLISVWAIRLSACFVEHLQRDSVAPWPPRR